MAATIGPLFAALVTAPRDWNEGTVENTRYLKTHQGLGFETLVYSRELIKALDAGVETWVFFAQVLREDAETLFAFSSPLERLLFSELKDIDGIGAKFAATALLEFGVNGIKRLIESPGSAPAKLPGLGPKTLEKIKNGVKAKREKFAGALKFIYSDTPVPAVAGAAFRHGDTPLLIVQALTMVGLRPDETDRFYGEVVAENPESAELPTGELIKQILKRRAQFKEPKRLEESRQ